ncbi:MAG: bifunctional methylenetetrahydrofolate dehydrogenase/methenyltetrahydrofolate cyclohydrolase FolD [Phreatobacter sp.]|uniref:bifunctional methylenetetrahydrofolate dehydrogenase/methenyltetrahydrofolate cyclohydrolase FolD n=1 Tax=Phreatobacter sp. TaxID=1966341 RepID=UPI002733FAEA|nr:bifunctional methylenetetrahydrofolate dehydrogenase/methenyltetrahydrofolate cyclohydrolase FolD [Phreatobacter sp.]MDP2801593.1 bifunctional methylenetetrahydrofolate dehydrogenase/methenyltetrahydrofolate cyclohydrolase FolD [Phreatobacter sp.]
MSATRIDGKAVAARVLDQVRDRAAAFTAAKGRPPGLAVVLVGEDPASQVYVRNKGREADAAGFRSEQHTLPLSTSQAELLAIVARLNADPGIDGILVQLPLPKGIDTETVLLAIDPAKDVDGFHPINVGLLGTGAADKALVPCTPAGSVILVESVLGPSLAGKHAVVVGRSNIVGKPVAQLLLQRDATVTIAHSRTADLPAICRMADVLVAAVGRPEMIRGDWVKPGAVVIDVGINRIAAPEKGEGKTRLVGDVATEEAAVHAAAITPVPGGVGPMTIALLMANTVAAAHLREGLPRPHFGA